MQNNILIDTSFLYALSDINDKYHVQAVKFARSNKKTRVIPDVVLTEVTHLLYRSIGHHAILTFLKAISLTDAQLEPVSIGDLKRIHEIMEKYADAKLDFVDCCIMALAERLNISQICTFDRRDFPIFRPTHCEHLELLP
jgi:uncharacterized protein